tara:strand:- start:466 stop:621 length:156 start_codon:yes stop_codon:yes gene_type:complete
VAKKKIQEFKILPGIQASGLDMLQSGFARESFSKIGQNFEFLNTRPGMKKN